MKLKGKALFNLMKLTGRDGVPSWAVEDLEVLSIDQLFKRLKKLGISLDEPAFSLYAENSDHPEELAECFYLDPMSQEECDQIYLLVFELWKRLCKDKFCLSVFCDTLDRLIEAYDERQEEEGLQEALLFLEDVLDDAFDEGVAGSSLLQEVSSYSAHDLESFIVDYAADQIHSGNTLYASELIDSFSPYALFKRQFEWLKASLIALLDEDKADAIYRQILEDLMESDDVDSTLRFAEHLVHHGHLKLFLEVAGYALGQLRTEEEFQFLLLTISEYYRCLDKDEISSKVLALLNQRYALPVTSAFNPQDKDVASLKETLSL